MTITTRLRASMPLPRWRRQRRWYRVVCTACPRWSAGRWVSAPWQARNITHEREEAVRAALRHTLAVHPELDVIYSNPCYVRRWRPWPGRALAAAGFVTVFAALLGVIVLAVVGAAVLGELLAARTGVPTPLVAAVVASVTAGAGAWAAAWALTRGKTRKEARKEARRDR